MKKNIVYFVVFSGLVCFFIFLIHLKITKTAVYGDGRYYYSILRSLVIDGDLDYSNEYDYYKIKESITPTGYLANKYPPGSSFLWLPLFTLIHFLARGNGFSIIYEISVGLTTIIITMIGLYFLYKTLVVYFSREVSFFTILVILFGTNLFYYAAFDVINSHSLSFASASLYFYLLLKKRGQNNWFLQGMIGGLTTLIRTQDILFLLPSLMILLNQKTPFLKRIKHFFIFILGWLITFLPQIYFWKTLYGTFYNSPYLNKTEGFSFLKPQIIGILFNSQTGLFFWTPVVFLGIIYLLFSFKRKVKKVLLITYLIQFYLISSWSSWNQGASFGIRMLISTLPIISFGLADFLSDLKVIKKMIGFSIVSITINTILIMIFLVLH